MSFRNISSWSIRNPVPPLVLFLALTIAGLVAFAGMQVNNQPDISLPFVQVFVAQPGAAPPELETQVTQKLEAALRSVNGVDSISSRVQDGSSSTTVAFGIGTPIDRAVNDVRDAVASIRGDLPDGILEPRVERVNSGGGVLAFIAVSATDMTLEELSWFVDNDVSRQLLSVPGMSQVSRSGGVTREMRVILDPAKLQAAGLTASQINAQLRAINMNGAGGRAEIAGSEQSVRVVGNASEANALENMRINVAGRSLRLGDLAIVRDRYAEQRNLAKMNGRQVTAFSITKARGASDVTVYDKAMVELRKIERQNPKVRFTQLFTTVDDTRQVYKSAMEALWEGALLAVFVVFLFLRDWRATVISAVAIPLSTIPAFWFMSLMGFTLNGISLLALSLVAGVLVDDAIVEIENIVRHMRMGKTPYQASIDAADEIGLAVLATTMAIVAVFLPVGLMPGVSGQYFQQFGLTVVVAVLASLAVARLITPLLAAYFLKPHGTEAHGGRALELYLALLRWTIDTTKAREVKAAGRRWRARLHDHRLWVVGFATVTLVGTVISFATLDFIIFPPENKSFSQVQISMPPGTTLKQTVMIADEAAAILRKEPEVLDVFEDVNVGEGSMFVTLRKDRNRSSQQFERQVGPRLAQIADARVTFQSQSSGFGRDVTIMLAGSDSDLVERTARRIVDEMRAAPELMAPRIDGDLPRPELVIKPRLDLAAEMGVSTSALSQTIRIATQGEIDQNAAKFSLRDRQIPIRVMIDEDARSRLSTIQNLPVPTLSGGSVPLQVVAEISFGAGPSVLRRYNQSRRVAIGADLAPGVVSATKVVDALPTVRNLPSGVERVAFGESKLQAELVTNFVTAVLAGIALVFAVLVLLYRRILPPLVNMGSLLLAPLGGALALHLCGFPASMPVMIGVLMLFGIVAKNSILLVDFALEEMDKGVDRDTAIVDAGHKRAQPIVMTTVAMVAGMIPTALALSEGGGFRQPMSITVIGGLIMSTALTLMIIPALFSLAVGIEARLGPKLRNRLTTGGEHAPAIGST